MIVLTLLVVLVVGGVSSTTAAAESQLRIAPVAPGKRWANMSVVTGNQPGLFTLRKARSSGARPYAPS
jgi:hypothetical protein